jgi:putative peptidoglycan lipid II flippase
VSEERNIVRAAGQVGFFTLLSRMTGLIRDIIIGSLFGAGLATDAFFVAFRIPNLFRRLVAEGATNAAIIPVVTDYLVNRPEAETQDMIQALTGMASGILLVLMATGIACAAPLVRLFAPGFDAHTLALTVGLTQITFLYLFCIGLVALATGVLNAQRHFFAPAFAPVLLNIAIIGCALGLSGFLDQPIFSLAYGVALGGVCQLVWQVPTLLRLGIPIRPRWQPRHPAVRRIGILLLPVVFGTATYQLSLLVNTILASLLSVGSVSALWYASRLFEFPQGIIVSALTSGALPSLSTQAQQQNYAGVSDSLSFALRVMNIVVLPATAGLFVLAVPMTATLFFRGAFGADQVLNTAHVLQGLAIGLWALAVSRLLTACLYALGDTRTPVAIGLVSFFVNVCFSLILMGRITVSADASGLAHLLASLSLVLASYDLGAVGLALAASLGTTVNMLLLGVVLSHRVSAFPWTAWRTSLGWSLLASIAMAGPVWWIAQQVNWLDPALSIVTRIGVLLLSILVGIISYGLIIWRGDKPELQALIDLLPQRLLRRLPQLF